MGHIKALNLALDYGLTIEKVQNAIKLNQEALLKPYIDMNTELRKKAKNDSEKTFNLMNNSVFGKTMENIRSHRDIKHVTTYKKEISWCLTTIQQKNCQKNYWQSK